MGTMENETQGAETSSTEHAGEACTELPSQESHRVQVAADLDEPSAEEAEVGTSFSIVRPVKFAAYAAVYYTGRAADGIVSLYSRAVRLDKGYIASFNKSSGIAHVRQGRWEKAIPLLEKAAAAVPGDVETRMRLAEAYCGVHQYEKAAQHLEKVLAANPESGPALRALGIVHLRMQDYQRAIECLEGTVRIDPEDAQAFYRLGTAYDNMRRFESAVECFKRATVIDPRFAKAYQALGFTYESMGDRESAVGCLKKALELE